jgi:hypothetical protein
MLVNIIVLQHGRKLSKKICCLSDNFIISSQAVSGIHDSLQVLLSAVFAGK